jgi:hypothetical protein
MTLEEELQRCARRIADAATAMDIARRKWSAKATELANARVSDQAVRQWHPD